MELKLKALILDEVHNIEVVRLLLEHKVNDVGHWYWQKQLRFYLKSSKLGEKLSGVGKRWIKQGDWGKTGPLARLKYTVRVLFINLLMRSNTCSTCTCIVQSLKDMPLKCA